MLLESFDIGIAPQTLHLLAGLALGLVFGIAAQISRFCLRRTVTGPMPERAGAGAVWLTALATAIAGFALFAQHGLIDLGPHRFLSTDVPVAAIVIGGLAFGVGMVLTRGCASRLTVLSATGNLRALLVLVVFAMTAQAAMRGVLAPLRVSLSSLTMELPMATLFQTALGPLVLLIPVGAAAAALAWRSRTRPLHLVLGAVIGLTAVAGWAATSVLLQDVFDPLPAQAAAFTAPWGDSLFWAIASSAISAGFGTGFIGGVLAGSFLSAATRRELDWQSFDKPQQTLRYLAGGALMGAGGVLAGGCTVGAGLSGVAMGSVAAILALASIAMGGWLAALPQSRTALAAS